MPLEENEMDIAVLSGSRLHGDRQFTVFDSEAAPADRGMLDCLSQGTDGAGLAAIDHVEGAAGVALNLAGLLLTVWARAYLGRNWSGRATIKEGHELVRNGPYALVRHPIYTGLLIAAIGTAIAFGQVRNLAALPLLLLGFRMKLREEERLLFQAFGAQYSAYQQAVRSAIIPFIL